MFQSCNHLLEVTGTVIWAAACSLALTFLLTIITLPKRDKVMSSWAAVVALLSSTGIFVSAALIENYQFAGNVFTRVYFDPILFAVGGMATVNVFVVCFIFVIASKIRAARKAKEDNRNKMPAYSPLTNTNTDYQRLPIGSVISSVTEHNLSGIPPYYVEIRILNDKRTFISLSPFKAEEGDEVEATHYIGNPGKEYPASTTLLKSIVITKSQKAVESHTGPLFKIARTDFSGSYIKDNPIAYIWFEDKPDPQYSAYIDADIKTGREKEHLSTAKQGDIVKITYAKTNNACGGLRVLSFLILESAVKK